MKINMHNEPLIKKKQKIKNIVLMTAHEARDHIQILVRRSMNAG